MRFSGILLVGFVAAAQAGVVGKVVKGIFSRDELEALAHQNNAAIIAGYITKIKTNTVPIGLVNALKSGGCNPPSKGKRSFNDDITDVDILLTRAEHTPAQKAAARKAASNPASLPAPIKSALAAAGWTGTCANGAAAAPGPAPGAAAGAKKPRSLDFEFDDFEFNARDLDLDELELLARDYDSDFFYSE
ncbi:MAG: hypothetical protein GOMPHAMPRED_007176 [Gomphillus americanus]|uniref:Uncharacterized protein n=1 Tax=Gomphillus americanus TaxID=1940652 RepID=A0A8H3EXT8_9LECA|nr:MAG: hypothetical protein GOMPHAMPRED_007176 [Gomphillus americanus]